MIGGLAISGGRPAVPHEGHRRWPDVRPEDREAVLAVLDRGVLCGPFAKYMVRMVTHFDVDRAGIDRALAALRDLLRG